MRPSAAGAGGASAATSARTSGPAARNGSVSAIRRYSGLAKRRLDGEYGERWTGATGVIAWTGLTSTTPAPSRAEPLTSVRRSVRSPMPQEPAERSAYSCTIQPHAAGTGGSVGGVTTTEVRRSPRDSVCQPSGRSAGSW